MKKQLLIFVLAISCTQMWALDAPTLTSPSTNYQNAFTRIVLSGTKGKNDSYQLQVDTTRKFNSPLLKKETASILNTSFSSTITDLYFNTHYYWRVRSISATDTSAWSEVRDFYTNHPVEIVGPNNTDVTETYYPQQNLQWKAHPGCGTYTIEIDTVSTFNSPAKSRQTWSKIASTKEETISQTVQDLYLGKMIYWRIKYYNQNDSSAWSETGQFHTLSKAKGESPKDLTDALTTQTFKWEYKKGLTNVIIELDTTDRFNSPAKRTVKSSGSAQSYCYTTISEMYFGKDYYWRVKAYHSKDTTDWSDVLHFKTYNHCNLSSPADGNTGNYTKVSLYYSYVSDISKYQVQLDTTPRFNSSQLQTRMSSTSSSSYAYETYSELLFGQDYYWRVRRCHSKDTSNWSETRMFSTYSYCPLTATPTDSATGVSTSPYLYFNACYGISKYQQQIDTTPLFNSPVMESKIVSGSEGSDYNYTYHEDLYFGKTYYRRTRRCHSKDTSDWSVTRCFTTIERGAYSTTSGYLSIAKGATGIAINPKLYYYYRSYIDSVEIQIDTREQFDSPLFQSIRVKEASSQQYAYEYPKNQLLYGTTYYWRIRNSHSKDVSDWTYPRYFTTISELPKPVLIAPEDRTPVRIDSVVFAWHPCKHTNGDATQYTLQLAWDGGFDSIYQQITVTDTTTWLSLPDETSLFWRVQGENSRGKSPWSDVRGINPAWTLPTPELMTPSAEADTYTWVPFKWHSVTNADTYCLQVCRSAKFDVQMAKDTAFADTAHNIIYFFYGRDYYWRVRAVNKQENLISKWSEVRHFRTSDSVTLDYADDPDATKQYYCTQTLRWFNHVGSTGYILEIDSVADFTSRGKRSWSVAGSSSTNATETITQQVSQLYLGCFNYWRVRAVNKKDTSDWSEVRRFHTLGKAEANYPSDSLTNSDTKRNFGWKYFNGLDSALIQLDTVETFNSPALRTVKSWAYNQNDAYAEINNMYFGKRYYWRVANFHKRDTTEWSDTRTFTTYDWGVQKSPSDGATGIVVQPKLTYEYSNWLQAYMLQLDTTSTFDSPLLRDTTLRASSQTYAYWKINQDLLYGTTYYWRVADVNKKDTSNWSLPWAFTTTYKMAPPTITTPSNQTVVTNGDVVTFSWNAMNDAVMYIFQLSDDGQFNTYLHQDTLTGTTISMILPDNSILYWRVQAVNSEGRSPWSNVWGINTGGTTGWNDNHNHNRVRKVIQDGRIYIIQDNKKYNLIGLKMED